MPACCDSNRPTPNRAFRQNLDLRRSQGRIRREACLTRYRGYVSLPDMGFLIGTDEAGYGPNLGPLVVSASVWHVPQTDLEQVDLYDQLAPVVTRNRTADRLAIADSKRLFRPGRPGHPGAGLEPLERGVLSGADRGGGRIARHLATVVAAPLSDRVARNGGASLVRGLRVPVAARGRPAPRSRSGQSSAGAT